MYNNPWEWVCDFSDDLEKAGADDSAKLINQLSDHFMEGYPEKTLALLPEAKILAKNLNNPWLEVHLGHCEMRTRVGCLAEGETVLPEVVTLFERANQEETKDSPFSFCITHDMVGCYGNIDGPGWAEERIETCSESFSQITPKRSCFMCMSNEIIDAYIDIGKYQEGLDFLDKQLAAMEAADADLEHWEYGYSSRSQLFTKLGRYEEALELLEKAIKIKDSPWRDVQLTDNVKKAHLLALLGRTEEAFEVLPPFSQLNPDNRMLWLETIQTLHKAAPEINDWQFANASKEVVDHFSKVGSHRHTINAACIGIEMALARQTTRKAKQMLNIAKAHLPKLKQDLGATDLVNEMEAKINNSAVITLPVPPSELLQFLANKDKRSPEEEVEVLLQALAEQPDDQELCAEAAEALAATNEEAEGELLLKSFLDRNSLQSGPVLSSYSACLFENNKLDELTSLADEMLAIDPAYAHYLYCKLASKNEDWEALAKCALAAMPHKKLTYPHRYLALAYIKQNMFSKAVETFQSLLEEIDDPEQHYLIKWDIMIAASADENWLLVKQIAASLEIECEVNDQPFDDDYGIVIIVSQKDGERFSYYANRTGPVTARILEHASNKVEQVVGDTVIFHPQAIYPNTEEDENFIPSFELEHVLYKGGYSKSYFVQGPIPEKEKFDAFAAEAKEQGWDIWVEQTNGAEIIDSATNQTHPHFFFSIAQKKEDDPKQLEALLRKHTANWELPMIWIGLADTLKQDLQPQFDLIERYGLG